VQRSVDPAGESPASEKGVLTNPGLQKYLGSRK